MFEIPPAPTYRPSGPPRQIKITTALAVFAAICIVVAIIAALANQSSLPVGGPPSTTTIPPSTTTIRGSMTEKEFDADVRLRLPEVNLADAKSVSRNLCRIIKNDGFDSAMIQYITLARTSGVDARSAGIVAFGGVSTYCPEHLDAMDAWSRQP